MKKQLLFKDDKAIERELKDVRSVAQMIMNLVSKMRKTFENQEDYLKELESSIYGFEGAEHFNSLLEEKQGINFLRNSLDELRGMLSKHKLSMKDFILTQDRKVTRGFVLTEDWKVKPVIEDSVIEQHSFYIDSEEKQKYFDKVNAFVKARDELETFLSEHKLKNIESNEISFGSAEERFNISSLLPNQGVYYYYQKYEPNWKALRVLN